tara:strand:- start:814 stop:993 length:180 start_codon:yes stop_codon:yes gene_type:complete
VFAEDCTGTVDATLSKVPDKDADLGVKLQHPVAESRKEPMVQRFIGTSLGPESKDTQGF